MVRILVSAVFLLAGVVPGFAHGGHLGDLAGHSHWLGWGMVAAAGVIIAVLGTRARDEQEDGEEVAEDETVGETTPT